MSGELYKLHYFNMRGVAETIRLILSSVGEEFQDIRFTREEWPEIKPTIPTKKMPYLITPEGKGLVQSLAIARYLALKYDLYPKELDEIYLVERAISQVADISNELLKYFFSPEDQKVDLAKEFEETKGKDMLETLSGFLEEDDRICFLGDRVTLAEYYYFNVHDSLKALFPSLLEQFPRLQKLIDHVIGSNEGVAKWLEKRPQTLI